MAYNQFAYWYDDLNVNADYDALAGWITKRLQQEGISAGIVADLGCGTGEVTLRLFKAGYDMIAIDKSFDMLSVLRSKIPPEEMNSILLLQQDLAELDLYGTIVAAVSTFDTFNHLKKEQVLKALKKAALFMEPGGIFIFDVNTPYKNKNILAENTFDIQQDEDTVCEWKNTYDPALEATKLYITLKKYGKTVFEENFIEYAYSLDFWRAALEESGFCCKDIYDGETFSALSETSQRYLIVAQKHTDRQKESCLC